MSGKACIQTQILQPPESVLASHVGVLSAEPQFPRAHPGECSWWSSLASPTPPCHVRLTVPGLSGTRTWSLIPSPVVPQLARLRVPSSLVSSKGVEKMPVWVLRHKPYP